MATKNVKYAASATLTANTADTVNLGTGITGQNTSVAVSNRGTTDPIFFRLDGVAAVKDADENYCVMPGQSVIIAGAHVPKVSLISNGAMPYTVQAV